MVGMLSGGSPEPREKHNPGFVKFQAEYSRPLFPDQKGNTEDRPE
jgi:hypothetical protein